MPSLFRRHSEELYIQKLYQYLGSKPKAPEVPIDLPGKIQKILELRGDRRLFSAGRFSRGRSRDAGDDHHIYPCWDWDRDPAEPQAVMPMNNFGVLERATSLLDGGEDAQRNEQAFPQVEHLPETGTVPGVVYEALPDNSWFRLLILQPSDDMWAPIHCQLKPFSRNQARVTYEALSYAWNEGDREEPYSLFNWRPSRPKVEEKGDIKWRPQQIICNGQELPVKGNLGCSLLHLRHPSRARAVWVDAICINQRDAAEVSEQIQMMPEIYGQAYRTVVWLGMESEAYAATIYEPLSLPCPEAAMALVCHIVKSWDLSQPASYSVRDTVSRAVEVRQVDSDSEFTRTLDGLFSCQPPHPRRKQLNGNRSPRLGHLDPLHDLFGVSWFGRKWVIQEVALSRSVDVMFHNCSISWRWVGLAAAIMRMRFDDALRAHRLYHVYHAYLMFRLSENYNLDPASMTFVELLRLTASFKTGEQNDFFFSVSGLETSDHSLERQPLLTGADYAMSYDDICTSVARRIIDAARSKAYPLSILEDSGASRSIYAKKPAPSWVPEWRVEHPGMLSPWSLDDNFAASRGLKVYVDTSSSDNSLVVQGLCVSTILSPCGTEIKDENNMAASIDQLNEFPSTSSHLEVYSRTLCAGRDSQGRRERNRAAMVLPFVSFALYGIHPGTAKYKWVNACRESLPEEDQNPWSSQRIRGWNEKWIAARQRFSRAAGLVAQHRRLFISTSGHLGLGPRDVSPGDEVWVLAGAAIPFILRGGEDGRKILVGPCYIDDIMDGEAVSAAKSGERHLGLLWSEELAKRASIMPAGPAVSSDLQTQRIIIE
ncbi:heterokaryon incompatibility protein-domain-containing protein [Rhypophila decipiens]|uniref:Heterokaryon incompatibility protein-domain-containing protein n=1 Tax=Rhypophila decipiens TaxID=261697 RepID=A0AAN6Y8Q2_9PEZI|nr:heterokaryon incompatibility protein-domain-containing protein [Rhypophila decipiens]